MLLPHTVWVDIVSFLLVCSSSVWTFGFSSCGNGTNHYCTRNTPFNSMDEDQIRAIRTHTNQRNSFWIENIIINTFCSDTIDRWSIRRNWWREKNRMDGGMPNWLVNALERVKIARLSGWTIILLYQQTSICTAPSMDQSKDENLTLPKGLFYGPSFWFLFGWGNGRYWDLFFFQFDKIFHHWVATILKLVRETLPDDARCTNETMELISQCCVGNYLLPQYQHNKCSYVDIF